MTRGALTESMIRIALLFQKERGERDTDAQAVYAVAKALGVSEASVLHCVRAVTQDRSF